MSKIEQRLAVVRAVRHLLAQALVSTDALLYDEKAVEKFREMSAKAGGSPAGPQQTRSPCRTRPSSMPLARH